MGFINGTDVHQMVQSQGRLPPEHALAITAHPDFDDTPLFDENGDGDPANDGADWHSHWVVLVEDKACTGGLKVRDVSPGQDLLPATAPGLPIALDSPGMSSDHLEQYDFKRVPRPLFPLDQEFEFTPMAVG